MYTEQQVKEIAARAAENALKVSAPATEPLPTPAAAETLYSRLVHLAVTHRRVITRWVYLSVQLYVAIWLNVQADVHPLAQYFSGVLYGVLCIAVLMFLLLINDVAVFTGWDLYETLEKNPLYRILLVMVLAPVFAFCVYIGSGNQDVSAGRAVPYRGYEQRADDRRTDGRGVGQLPRGHDSSAAAERGGDGRRPAGTTGRGAGAAERLE